MEQKKIDRINELARKKKTVGLTEEETQEQAQLRAEYLSDFRKSFGAVLDNTVIQYPDGTRQTLDEFRESKKKK